MLTEISVAAFTNALFVEENVTGYQLLQYSSIALIAGER